MNRYYPHCSLLGRDRILDLNGKWHFRTDPEGRGEEKDWHRGGEVRDRELLVPSPWQLQADDLLDYCGSAWYERDFQIPDEFADQRSVIVFEAVDYLSRVWVNGEYVGEHEGGFLPFKFDITPFVRFGETNTVTLKVKDFDGSEQEQIPHGYQVWGQQISGIWQNVWIEAQGGVFVDDIFALPNVDESAAEIRIEAASVLVEEQECVLQVEVVSPHAESLIQKKSIRVSSDTVTREAFLFCIEKPVLWDFDNPELYQVKASVV